MSNVPARSAALAREAWRVLTSRVIDDMAESGEDPTDTALYRERRSEASCALAVLLASGLDRAARDDFAQRWAAACWEADRADSTETTPATTGGER